MSNIEAGGGASEGASDEERAEAGKFNRMVDEGKITGEQASTAPLWFSPDNIERVESLINGYRRSQKKGLRYILSDEFAVQLDPIGEGWSFILDLPGRRTEIGSQDQKHFEEETKHGFLKFQNSDPNEWWQRLHDLNRDKYGDRLDTEDIARVEVLTDIAIPDLKGKHVLEIGAFTQDEWDEVYGGFLKLSLFFTEQKSAKYTAIDSTIRRDKGGSKKEQIRMDVAEAGKKLHGRKYDFILGLGFWGAPTYQYSEAKKLETHQVEKDMLVSLDSLLRDGGLMLFVNRETPDLEKEDFENAGYQFCEKRVGELTYWLVRKLGISEKEK